MCPKKKKKTTRRVKEETQDTTSESSSNDEEEQEVNKISRERVWPGTRVTARQGGVRMIRMDNSNEISSDEGSTDEDQEEKGQGKGDRTWPGTRDKARKRGNEHGTQENKLGDNIQAKHGNKDGKADQQQDDAKTNTGKDANARGEYKRPTEGQEEENKELAIDSIYRRLTCEWCQRTFHKSSGRRMHICYALTPARRIYATGASQGGTEAKVEGRDKEKGGMDKNADESNTEGQGAGRDGTEQSRASVKCKV